jgi:anti-sigma B factor antagonist
VSGQTDGMVRTRGRLALAEHTAGGIREITAEGDLDLAGAPGLCVRLDAARRVPGSRVLLDLSRVAFCDSTGLRALIGARYELAAAACTLAVVAPPGGPVGRLLELTGLREFLPARESREAARAVLGG